MRRPHEARGSSLIATRLQAPSPYEEGHSERPRLLPYFLKKNVEGYLFEDIATLKRAKQTPGKTEGAVGYPLLVTTCAGIELLGALVSPTKFIRKNGQAHFIRFWKKYLYPEKPRVSVGNAVYQLARHGLAHVFVVKGNLVVVKDEPREHLVYSKTGGLRINAGQLADDLIDAYFSKVKPLLDDDEGEINRETMSKRLIDMKDLYEKDAAVFLSVLETPPRPKTPHPGDGASGASSPVYTNTASSLSNPPFPPTPEKGTISLFNQPEDRF